MGWIGRSMGRKQQSKGWTDENVPSLGISIAKRRTETPARINSLPYSAQSRATAHHGIRPQGMSAAQKSPHVPPAGGVRRVETRFIASLTARMGHHCRRMSWRGCAPSGRDAMNGVSTWTFSPAERFTAPMRGRSPLRSGSPRLCVNVLPAAGCPRCALSPYRRNTARAVRVVTRATSPAGQP